MMHTKVSLIASLKYTSPNSGRKLEMWDVRDPYYLQLALWIACHLDSLLFLAEILHFKIMGHLQHKVCSCSPRCTPSSPWKVDYHWLYDWCKWNLLRLTHYSTWNWHYGCWKSWKSIHLVPLNALCRGIQLNHPHPTHLSSISMQWISSKQNRTHCTKADISQNQNWSKTTTKMNWCIRNCFLYHYVPLPTLHSKDWLISWYFFVFTLYSCLKIGYIETAVYCTLRSYKELSTMPISSFKLWITGIITFHINY